MLRVVAEQGDVEARDVAAALGMGPETAAMALLRAYRTGLLTRTGPGGCVGFGYCLTEKGRQRLEYLDGERPVASVARVVSFNPKQGDDNMRTKKLHSGTYHCPECLYEVDLTAEHSLKCQDCGGRLSEGGLPDEDGYEDDE